MSVVTPSLRFKLTLWFLGIFTAVFLGVLTIAWVLHGEAIRRMMDEGLENSARGVVREMQRPGAPPLTEGLLRFQPVDRTYAVLAVRDAEGEVIASRARVNTERLPPIPRGEELGHAAFHGLSGDLSRELLGSSLTSRMVCYRFIMPDGSVRYLDLARTVDMRERQEFLNNLYLVGGSGSLVASAVAAWLVAGRAVAPMKRIAQAATRVDPEHISSRIDVKADELEVQRLQTALNDALARLEAGYRAQDRFISHVAHDLKTPIAVMLTESQVLRPGSVSLEEFEEYRVSMISELQRLGGLVESFLTLARADHSEAMSRATEVSVIDAVMEAVAECDPEADLNDVRLVVNLDPSAAESDQLVVSGDMDLLRTMIVNLVRNAIRFSPPKSQIEIRIASSSTMHELSVRDYGPGIPEKYLQAVFDRFVTVPSNEPRATGTGLGLAISRTVAELHGGTITVENCDEGGCRFVVGVPACAESPEFPDRGSDAGDENIAMK